MEIKAKKRSEIPTQHKWKLEDMYPSQADWQKDVDALSKKCEELLSFQGKLTSGQALADCLDKLFEASTIVGRVYVYANMKLHEDATISESQGLAGLAQTAYVKYSAAFSFIQPEILTHSEETINNFIDSTPGLGLYKHYLNDIMREKAHVLSAEIEAILANAGEVTGAPKNIFDMLDNADLKFGNIVDADGNTVELTHGRYHSLMQSQDRRVRKETFTAYYGSYSKLINTIAATLISSVKKDNFLAKTRNYNSALEASLSGSNIPGKVYTQLIDSVHCFLPAMHRYMAIRKRALKLDELHLYDMAVPLVSEVDVQILYEDAKKKLSEGLAPLGEAYLSAMNKGMESGWIDVYENEGKQSGGYCWGTFSSHPYVLLNYDNKLSDLFTLAHEMGHAMHSYYTWETQPKPYAGYTTFLAEVASTVNETLLMDYMLKTTTCPKTRAYLIVEYIDQFRGTIFRQTMFAEFEKIVHEMADNGQPLTVDSLGATYRGLVEKYFGTGVVIDDQIAMEWARIPHFYTAYYVFQYATGYSAAVAFNKRLQTGNPRALEAYLGFLKAGSSEYSIDILKKAGVDMSTSTPVNEALKVFESLVEELDKLV